MTFTITLNLAMDEENYSNRVQQGIELGIEETLRPHLQNVAAYFEQRYPSQSGQSELEDIRAQRAALDAREKEILNSRVSVTAVSQEEKTEKGKGE